MLLASIGPGGPATFDLAKVTALGNLLSELEADPGRQGPKHRQVWVQNTLRGPGGAGLGSVGEESAVSIRGEPSPRRGEEASEDELGPG